MGRGRPKLSDRQKLETKLMRLEAEIVKIKAILATPEKVEGGENAS